MKTCDPAKVFALAAAVLLAGACSTSAQQPKAPGPTDTVATVGTTAITLEQVDRKALEEPASSFGNLKLSQAIYEARRAAADELVGDLLLDQEAKRRGVERAALDEQEITSKVKAVTETEIAAWYEANQQRVQGATLDQVRAPIQRLNINFSHADELFTSGQTASAKSESCLDSSISLSLNAALACLTDDSERCR